MAQPDFKPRILVHHELGDFVIDPWTPQGFDLSLYGVRSFDVNVDPATLHPVITVHHILGDFVIDPMSSEPSDLSRYGIMGYEVVLGTPTVSNSLLVNLGLIVLIVGAGWAFLRSRR